MVRGGVVSCCHMAAGHKRVKANSMALPGSNFTWSLLIKAVSGRGTAMLALTVA
jgi:hypothetical protein